jgi:pimeloyl-ACP methyl ester carboxylesterase
MLRLILSVRLLPVILTVASIPAIAQTTGGTSVHSDYAPVNGMKMYYEIHGTGEPLVLVHGGVVGISMFGGNVDALGQSRQVIAVELQGHGHTRDIDRPLSFEALSDDVFTLIKHLGFQRVDVMGYSLGGGVALQVAIRHPEVVRKLVVVSAPCKRRGMYPEVLAAMDQMGPKNGDMMKHSPLSKMYPDVDWTTLFTKLGKLLSTEYDWSKEVAEIKAPTMLVFADTDAVRPEHIVEFYKLIGGGRRDAGQDASGRPINELAILPGQTHYTIDAAPALVANVIPFLNTPLPATN